MEILTIIGLNAARLLQLILLLWTLGARVRVPLALIELLQGPHFDLVYLVQGQLLHFVFALPQDVIVVPDLAHGVLVLLALLIELLL